MPRTQIIRDLGSRGFCLQVSRRRENPNLTPRVEFQKICVSGEEQAGATVQSDIEELVIFLISALANLMNDWD